MKLVEILARELKEWPVNSEFGVDGVVQDGNGRLSTVDQNSKAYFSVTANWWPGDCATYIENNDGFVVVTRSCEYQTAIVTHNEWLAEKARIEHSSIMTQWDGSGAPPVGTICGFRHHISQPWMKVEVRYVSDMIILLRFDGEHGDNEGAYSPDDCEFCTLENMAEEDALLALSEIESLHAEGGPAAVYDAGYRKIAEGAQ